MCTCICSAGFATIATISSSKNKIYLEIALRPEWTTTMSVVNVTINVTIVLLHSVIVALIQSQVLQWEGIQWWLWDSRKNSSVNLRVVNYCRLLLKLRSHRMWCRATPCVVSRCVASRCEHSFRDRWGWKGLTSPLHRSRRGHVLLAN